MMRYYKNMIYIKSYQLYAVRRFEMAKMRHLKYIYDELDFKEYGKKCSNSFHEILWYVNY